LVFFFAYIYTGGDVGAVSSRLKHRGDAGILSGRHQGVLVTDIDALGAKQLLARRSPCARGSSAPSSSSFFFVLLCASADAHH